MSAFKLFAKFQLNTSIENFTEVFEEIIHATSLINAEQLLELKISEMISGFSAKGLNWTLLEKCVSQRPVEDDQENFNLGKSLSTILL
ncbi:MAG TPA: hypothetical protein VMZ69_10515 [Saprospiraceae bacterium]|nr:hypothetical protein [Saprospiraceae bacterium]